MPNHYPLSLCLFHLFRWIWLVSLSDHIISYNHLTRKAVLFSLWNLAGASTPLKYGRLFIIERWHLAYSLVVFSQFRVFIETSEVTGRRFYIMSSLSIQVPQNSLYIIGFLEWRRLLHKTDTYSLKASETGKICRVFWLVLCLLVA